MTTSNLPPPGPFDFSKPDEWPRWLRRFKQFRSAAGLNTEPEARQVDTLLYCMGEEAEDVLTSTNITAEDRASYDSVIAKFESYFRVRRNVIFERARFNRRCQKEGESAEQYITELYGLVEFCDYGDLKDEMLRDRLVVGIRDTALSEKMQTDPTLTLEKAKTMIRQKEAAKEHSKELKEDSTHTLNRVQVGKRSHNSRTPKVDKIKNQCTRCGRPRHQVGERCPATGVTCYSCQKKGHFESQCLSKKRSISEVSTSQAATDEAFLGTVDTRTTTEQRDWKVTVKIRKHKVNFKLDTGAEVNAISEDTHKTLGRPKLCKPTQILYGPAKQPLEVVGVFSDTMRQSRNSTRCPIYVVKNLKTNLLSLKTITALDLIRRLASSSVEVDWMGKYPKVFTGLGTLGEEYTIKLKENVNPYSLYVPRNVPIPQRPKVKLELDRMESLGVISKVEQPTSWCAGMVVVPKQKDAVRICVDLKPLNNNVLREPHPIPTVDDVLAQLSGATHFSKLDANSGFWQIPLAEQSRPLTTFITPFGRYQFNKLPFGISSAPELFQRRMHKILEGLEGAVCMMDDVLIFGKDQKQHDERLHAVLKRLDEAQVTLNRGKCRFNKSNVKFLGHLIDQEGIRPDPEKTAALHKMKPPQSVSELRRFMGLVNQLGKFSSRIADISQPVRELLRSNTTWIWGPCQQKSFEEIKQELNRPVILKLYDPKAKTKVSADASSYGLGAVLLQSEDGDADTWRPIAYASRSLSDTEKRYAQIEKEALAATWACEKFSNYILGRPFTLESDHKPLIPLLNTKHLDDLPPRILRFRLRLAKYEYQAQHVPGKLLYAADALSRAPDPDCTDADLENEVETYLLSITIPSLPATQPRLKEYVQAQKDDSVCAKVRQYCQTEWPSRHTIENPLKPYWKARSSLSLVKDILLYNSRIVVPSSLRKQTLWHIHQGHQGIERSRLRAQTSVWWPCVTAEVKQYVENCRKCAKESRPKKEPLISTPLPEYPWQMVGMDLFELKGQQYLVVADYYSRYPECVHLSQTTSSHVIAILKAIFARHGIPEEVRSDNGPQFTSHEFSQFAQTYGFRHTTSSPHYPQSNGQAERMVQTMKGLLKKSEDPHLAILSYRATPMPWCGLSPSELLMGRKIRTTVPLTTDQLIPKWTYLSHFQKANSSFKDRQKQGYDHRHGTKKQRELSDGTEVWITTDGQTTEGQVSESAHTPRSYVIVTPSGELRRNRTQLNVAPPSVPTTNQNEELPEELDQSPEPPPQRIATRSQTGTALHPPRET